MKTIDREILEYLESSNEPSSLTKMSLHLSAGKQELKASFLRLNKNGLAVAFRAGRGRGYFIASQDAGIVRCVICLNEFSRVGKSKRETCSRPCAMSWGWKKNPKKHDARCAAISASHLTPEALARTAAHNKRRWSDPNQREKLKEQNRRRWANPESAAVVSAKIRIHHNKPEVKKFYSDLRKEWWADPIMRKKMNDAAKASKKVQAYRKKMSELVKERWSDPEFRRKWTAANKARNTPELRAANSARMKARHAAQRIAKQLREGIST